MLVYVTHTDTRDITPRIEEFLNKEGVKTAVLKSNSVKSEKREEWVNQRVKEKIDVLICNPRLVQTGLDLVDFPTLVWYETDYSVYTMRQASRRSWRIGQDQPVKVVFMVYEGTIQTDALKLVAKKMQSSLAVEGELPGGRADNLRRRWPRPHHDAGEANSQRGRLPGRRVTGEHIHQGQGSRTGIRTVSGGRFLGHPSTSPRTGA